MTSFRRSCASSIAFLIAASMAGCTAETRVDRAPPLRVADVLRGAGNEDLRGYARADAPRTFTFPADHGAHPEFRTEWWYFTGNLHAESTGGTRERFGYHLTFFRTATRPAAEDKGAPRSAWRTRHVWMAHFALTDARGGRMEVAERFARGALDLGGVASEPFAVWLGPWRVASTAPDGSFFPLQLHAATDEAELRLELTTDAGPVLQGDAGLSGKSSAPGNASYYYSFTRLDARGSVRIGDKAVDVTGSGWLDREWSTSALDDDQQGWDWFALQLDDGRELMWYQLRTVDGGVHAFSAGTLVGADGATTRLARSDVTLEPLRPWTSARSGATYPIGWRLAVPAHDLDLRIDAALDDQELDVSFRYWEGAVDVTGSATGVGYLEMTGYADR